MTDIKGFGIAPAGTSPFGFGAPATASPTVGKPLTKADGSQGDARKIDPVTKDYVIDPTTGRTVGFDGVQQQVYLALVTVKGSSAVADLGQEFTSLKLIPENIQALVEDKVREALAALIQKNKVQLIRVDTELNRNKALAIRVKWMDLTKRTTSETVV